ncbi:MAG TPA: hypothetical protein VET24_10275 [Actinomycetota bacterium]|nr:hypothetical protein [Actinomycetota bacterium]
MFRFRIAAAVVGVGVVLAGCSKGQVATTNPSASGGGNSAQLTSLIEGARAKAISAKTANFTQTINVTPVSGTAEAISINGSMDLPSKRIGMTFALPGVGDIQAVLDSGIIYEKIPQLASMLGGKAWFKIDPSSLKNIKGGGQFASLLASMDSLLKQAETQDPTQGLGLLAGVSGPVTTVGPDTVRGTATTHYKFTVDEAQAIAKLPADAQEAVKAFSSQLGITNIPTEAWLDKDGLIRRIHLIVDTSGSTSTPSPLLSGLPASVLPKSTDMTMELYDYGSPVTIAVPPADQVTDLGAMLSSLGG